jgi:sugar phosphate isomerase/epimerase
MYLGYNTNGLAHHSLPAAIELLAGIGYRGVGITLDYACLNPFDAASDRQLQEASLLLAAQGMRSVIETGARFLLDPRQKHEPTLVSDPRRGQPLRIEFLCRAIDAAAALGSDCVSLWSGVVQDGASRDEAMRRLCDGLAAVLEYADRAGVTVAFEPEPGMLIDSTVAFDELTKRVDSPRLKLTLDVGHAYCQGETPIPDVIRRWRDRLANVHIEDMRAGVHEHLMFGEGEMDFPPIIAALAEIGYDGGVFVELSRHSHEGPYAAANSYSILSPLMFGAARESRE